MFIHNFKYSLKTLFKDKMLIFWTFMFPIILGTLFNMAFSNIENSEKLDIIDIAIVNEKNDEVIKNAFDSLSDEDNENRLFNTSYVSLETANKLLNEDKIVGYLIVSQENEVVVGENGINQTIFKYVTEEVLEYQRLVNSVISMKMEEVKESNISLDLFVSNIYKEVIEKMNEEVDIKDISSKNLSYTMIEYYTLIAMTALYGGIFAVVSINKCLANMGTKGARVMVSPAKKITLILSSLLASYVAQGVGLFILFVYTIFVLNIDYGNNLLLVILTASVGTLSGLSLGVFVASLFKTSENTKTGILIAVTMAGCFLSGMMGITMKHVIDTNVPILNKINPAAMITDAFYSLYYYTDRGRFWFNIISLLVFSVVLITISSFSLRRQKYDSI